MYFTVESAVPIPARDFKRRGKWKTKFASMKIGDSFLVGELKQAISACNSAKRLGYAVTLRKVAEGYRVWKISGLM